MSSVKRAREQHNHQSQRCFHHHHHHHSGLIVGYQPLSLFGRIFLLIYAMLQFLLLVFCGIV